MAADRTLVVATGNPGKVRELERIIGDAVTLCLRHLGHYPEVGPIEETGSTFEENAAIKAVEVTRITGHMACADDSGLTVEALHGAPGVHSARYSGEDATDERNNALLLERMQDVPEGERTGHFVCGCVLSVPAAWLGEVPVREGWERSPLNAEVFTWTGVERVPGCLLREPRGDEGFGYDPLFWYAPLKKTFAEMTVEEKNVISHRGLAFRRMVEELHWVLEEISEA